MERNTARWEVTEAGWAQSKEILQSERLAAFTDSDVEAGKPNICSDALRKVLKVSMTDMIGGL